MFKAKKVFELLERIEGLLQHRLLAAKKETAALVVLREHIKRLELQNKDLMDRLMARDIPELKTYTLPGGGEVTTPYVLGEDEDIAGEVVESDE